MVSWIAATEMATKAHSIAAVTVAIETVVLTTAEVSTEAGAVVS